MPLARTVNVKTQLVAWFENTLIPALRPELRAGFSKRGATPFPRQPHRTPYLEDAAGALERVIPSSDWDWTEKHGLDGETPAPILWTTEPTWDAEGNQLTPGVPAHGWITAPVLDGNGEIVETGEPDPNPTVKEYNWRQVWKGVGWDTTAAPILEGCPDPTTGEWVNSIRIETSESRDDFTNLVIMRVRYTVEGDRTQEVWEEYTWKDVTTDRGVTWTATNPTAWVEVYNGPTANVGGP